MGCLHDGRAAADYADLSGFVRANGAYLNGYEAATAVGSALDETGVPSDPALRIEGGSGEVFAFARARPGEAEAPVVVHVIDDSAEPKPATLLVRVSCLGAAGGGLIVRCRAPKPYLEEEHARAQKTGDFSILMQETTLDTAITGGWLRLNIPAAHPWALLVILPKRAD